MKLLIVNGTPKTDGLCYSFVTAAEETAAELSADAEAVRLSGMNLAKCKMCDDGWGICFGEHRCAFGDKDGFNELQKKVGDADALVYLTPVYWGETSEEMNYPAASCEVSKITLRNLCVYGGTNPPHHQQ